MATARRLLTALCLAAVLPVAGCVMVDCCFTYYARGRLLDAATGSPLAGCRLAVEEDARFRPEQESPDWPGFSCSGPDGSFDDDFSTGLSWGYTMFFGFVVRGSRTGPEPHCLDSVILAVQDSSGRWRMRTVMLTPEQQRRTAPAERWLDLGTVHLDSAGN